MDLTNQLCIRHNFEVVKQWVQHHFPDLWVAQPSGSDDADVWPRALAAVDGMTLLPISFSELVATCEKMAAGMAESLDVAWVFEIPKSFSATFPLIPVGWGGIFSLATAVSCHRQAWAVKMTSALFVLSK